MSQRDQEVPMRHFAAGSARTGSDCVVVTGASSGIGADTAVALARRGIAVAIAARRGARLAETAKRCEAAGGQAHPVVAEAIFHPKPEIYTSAGLRAHALAYAEDPEARDALMRPVAETILGK
jgi:NAD(P)-dependent dehydrogenase (short-subunit alcohol dehydrogenase family)